MEDIIIWIVFFILALVVVIYAIYNLAKGYANKIEQEENIINKGKEYNAIYSGKFWHICGLSLAENSECILHLGEEKIVIESKSNIYNLHLNKILDMNIKDSKEVQNSISGAVGGALLFGPIGAFLGGTSTELHRFFIIIYRNKNNEEKCISFDMKDNLESLKHIYRYIENYNKHKEKRKIDL